MSPRRPRLDLDGRIVLITGGARGIGLATAREAARRGATCALLDLDGDLAAAEASALPGGAIGLAADVTDVDGITEAVDAAAQRLGGIDVLVANAGVGPWATTVHAGDREHQRRVLDVNLHGVWHTMWAGAPHVVRRQGHVVAVSSIAAFVLTPAWAAYAASKAAVEQLARSMRIELAPTGTTVGVAHFGLVDTALVREFETDPIARGLEDLAPATVSRPVSAESAAVALLDDVRRRRPRTVHPARWRAVYALRGIAGPMSDALVARDPRVRDLMRRTGERDRAARDQEVAR